MATNPEFNFYNRSSTFGVDVTNSLYSERASSSNLKKRYYAQDGPSATSVISLRTVDLPAGTYKRRPSLAWVKSLPRIDNDATTVHGNESPGINNRSRGDIAISPPIPIRTHASELALYESPTTFLPPRDTPRPSLQSSRSSSPLTIHSEPADRLSRRYSNIPDDLNPYLKRRLPRGGPLSNTAERIQSQCRIVPPTAPSSKSSKSRLLLLQMFSSTRASSPMSPVLGSGGLAIEIHVETERFEENELESESERTSSFFDYDDDEEDRTRAELDSKFSLSKLFKFGGSN